MITAAVGLPVILTPPVPDTLPFASSVIPPNHIAQASRLLSPFSRREKIAIICLYRSDTQRWGGRAGGRQQQAELVAHTQPRACAGVLGSGAECGFWLRSKHVFTLLDLSRTSACFPVSWV